MRTLKVDPVLPSGDEATIINTTSVWEVALVGTLAPSALTDDWFVASLIAKISANSGQWRIKDKNGLVVWTSSAEITTTFDRKWSALIRVVDASDWTTITIEVTTPSSAPRTLTIEDSSILFFMADSKNITDERSNKRQVNSIKFYSIGTSEAINGKQSTKTDLDFTELVVDGIMNDFIWDANSGTTMYSWSGQKIGVII